MNWQLSWLLKTFLFLITQRADLLCVCRAMIPRNWLKSCLLSFCSFFVIAQFFFISRRRELFSFRKLSNFYFSHLYDSIFLQSSRLKTCCFHEKVQLIQFISGRNFSVSDILQNLLNETLSLSMSVAKFNDHSLGRGVREKIFRIKIDFEKLINHSAYRWYSCCSFRFMVFIFAKSSMQKAE